jgi:FkbM family methyltransferase
MTRKLIQKTLGIFGLELRRTSQSLQGYKAQQELMHAVNPIIFDVGAHTGDVARAYRSLFPSGEIHCFEPFPKSFEHLVAQMEADPRVICEQIALADSTGSAMLCCNTSSATNSLLVSDPRGAAFWGDGVLDQRSKVVVPTTTVDAYCEEHAISRIDILKLDVQGGEYEVLKGAERMFSERRITMVYSELILCPTYIGQRKPHEYFAFFDAHGFELVDLFDPVRSHGKLIQSDALWWNSIRGKESN